VGSLLKLIKELVVYFKELNGLTPLRLQIVLDNKSNILKYKQHDFFVYIKEKVAGAFFCPL
jgi:hypothetical protein